jgi:hypothetical protein
VAPAPDPPYTMHAFAEARRGTRRAPGGISPSRGPVRAADPAVVLVEERELQAEARLGVVPVGLRLEQVVPGHAVVVGDHLAVLLGAEELLLQEHARR